jgi:hypothetical protein
MNKLNYIFAAMALSGMVLAGCGDDDGPTDVGTDTNTPTDSAMDTNAADVSVDTTPSGDCVRYCAALETNCSTVPQYADSAACESYCAGAGWPVGTVGEMAGNTIECRIYHAGVPAAGDAAMHCPHAGPSGSTVCGSVDYRTDAAADYTRVDRLGMPAISTALVSSANKNDYNDGGPANDAALDFAVDLLTNIEGLHTALDDDLTGLSLVPCSTVVGTTYMVCVEQEVAAGVSVLSLVVPDTIQIDGSGTAGFPNGRMLADQVMDVTLAIILLDLTATGQDATTFAGLPLNPAANDVAFNANFPYLAPAH